MGLDRTIDYRQDKWYEDLPSYDVVLEAMGGASVRKSYGLLHPGGRVVAYGASSLLQGERRTLRATMPQALQMMRGFNLLKQIDDSKTVVGLNLMKLWEDRGSLQTWFTPLASKLEDGTIQPVVYTTVPFANVPEAHRILAARENFGKVVLVP